MNLKAITLTWDPPVLAAPYGWRNHYQHGSLDAVLNLYHTTMTAKSYSSLRKYFGSGKGCSTERIKWFGGRVLYING